MKDFFFNISFESFEGLAFKVILFLLISVLVLFVIYFLLTKLAFRKNKQRKEVNLRLTYLWSIYVYLLAYNIYIGAFFYMNGVDEMDWTTPRFYLGLIAQITLYLALLALFLVKRYELNKIINSKSIN